jgi:hypothetical protein
MDNSLITKYLLVWVFAFASVVGENSNNGGRTWNTNNGINKPTLEYVFNVRLQSEANIKSAFQKLFCDNCDNTSQPTKTLSPKGKQVFDAIWGNTGLKNNLWNPTLGISETQARLQFTNWVSILDNRIFNFIKSR